MTVSDDRSARRATFRAIDFALPLFILLLASITGIVEPRFFSMSNLENLARQMVPLAIAATGQAFAVISGGLDLSVAAVISLSGVVGILVMNSWGIPAGIAAMILTGMIAGLTSGVLISYFRSTPLIITLGMMSIAQALALILAGGVPIYDIPMAFADAVGFGRLFGIPVTVLIALGTLVLGWLVLSRTVFGRYVYAIGSNRSAAEKSGIRVPLYIAMTYMVVGISSGIGAVVMTAWVGAAQPVAAPTLTLEAIAAVVLGGVAIQGGSGRIIHVIYGIVILGMLSNTLNMMGISAYFQTLAVGVVIILAVSLDRFRHQRR